MNRRRVRREYYLQVRVASTDMWNKICNDYFRFGDESGYFMTAHDWPVFIYETRPGANRAAEIGNTLMKMESFDDGETVDSLVSELSRIAGRPAAEWLYNTILHRHRTINREDQEDRAEAWLQSHDILTEIDAIPVGDYDDMFLKFPIVSGWTEDLALYGIFLYGYQIGKAVRA